MTSFSTPEAANNRSTKLDLITELKPHGHEPSIFVSFEENRDAEAGSFQRIDYQLGLAITIDRDRKIYVFCKSLYRAERNSYSANQSKLNSEIAKMFGYQFYIFFEIIYQLI